MVLGWYCLIVGEEVRVAIGVLALVFGIAFGYWSVILFRQTPLFAADRELAAFERGVEKGKKEKK